MNPRALIIVALVVLAACTDDSVPSAGGDDDSVTSTAPPTSAPPAPAGLTEGDPETSVRVASGDGWRLVDVARHQGFAYASSITFTPRGAQRVWEIQGIPGPPPPVDFATEVLITLVAVVSSGCEAITFDGLTITDDAVFGDFRHPTRSACGADDALPVTFVVAVERDALPEAFDLSITRAERCRDCGWNTIAVDMNDSAGTERLVTSRIAVVVGGDSPPDGTVRLVRWQSPHPGAEMVTIRWETEPTWWFDFAEVLPDHLEAYLAACTVPACEHEPSSCDGDRCDAWPPIGPVCSLDDPVLSHEDAIITIIFDDDTCTMDLSQGWPE